MYILRSENLTNLGGRMGTEYTFSNFEKYFNSLSSARKYAEKDYGSKLEWIKEKYGFRTKDLSYVMYHIRKIKTED